jgi:hypothetical protein
MDKRNGRIPNIEKKTFSLKSDNQPFEQASLAGGGKEKGGFLLYFWNNFTSAKKYKFI